MKLHRFFLALVLGVLLTLPCALSGFAAEALSFEATVTALRETTVVAPIGGVADELLASVGQRVSAGDALLTLRTNKVYATQAGTVTGLFGEPGECVDDVSALYGAAVYVDPVIRYTVSASTNKAYDSDATRYVYSGETVYLSCYSDGSHTGMGVVTGVSGSSYTVMITEGEFEIGETVNICREADYSAASRIGRGSVARTDPTAYTGTGSIVSFAVSIGDDVRKGDLLFETLDETFDACVMTGTQVVSAVSGVVASVDVAAGDTVAKAATVARLYADEDMVLEGTVNETDLGLIAEGDRVLIEYVWNEDEGVSEEGTITWISAIGERDEDTDTVTYAVRVAFSGKGGARYGMTANVYATDTADQSAAAPTPEPAAETVSPSAPE